MHIQRKRDPIGVGYHWKDIGKKSAKPPAETSISSPTFQWLNPRNPTFHRNFPTVMTTSSTARRHWRLLFWPTVLAVLVLSLIPPGPRLPDTGWDKSNHLLAFAVLAVLGLRSYPGSKGVLLVGLLAYGGVIEGLQSLAPDRFAEWADLLANALGLLFGWGLSTCWSQWRPSA